VIPSSAGTWLALGAALLLVPPVDPVRERMRVLADRGRLSGMDAPGAAGRRWRLPRVSPGPVLVWVAAPGIAVVVTVVAGPVLAVAALLIVASAGHAVLRTVRRRASAAEAERVLGALRVLAGELAAGCRPAAALRAAAESCPEHAASLGAAAELAADGADASPVLAEDAAFAPLAHAWRVAATTGAPLVAAVSSVAADAAAARDQARAVAAALAGPRSSAALLAVLPVLGVVLGAAMGASPLTFLVERPGGRVVCLVGVVLDVAGVLWTRRMTDRAERC